MGHTAIRTVGFEPTITGSRNRWIHQALLRPASECCDRRSDVITSNRRGSRRGRIRTDVFLVPSQADSQTFPRADQSNCQSTQRELNPHFRHGKAAGYRYIMGARPIHFRKPAIVCSRPHRERRIDCVQTKSHSSGIRGTRTLTRLVKSQGCCR